MKKKTLLMMVSILVFIIGVSIIAYPFVSNFWQQHNRELEIMSYHNSVTSKEEELLAQEWEKAIAYNQKTKWESSDAFSAADEVLSEEYLSVLNLDGIMGYIEIPSIGINLPIKHGTSEKTLEKAVGHLAQSNLPIGGSGNHAILTGHTGLPSSMLFTDLDKMMLDDVFYLHILDKTFAYEVDDISVIEPDDLEGLYPVDAEDYVSLITCTPYGINSHRLIVRGTRVELKQAENKIPSVGVQVTNNNVYPYILLALVVLVVMGVIVLLVICRRKHTKARKESNDKQKK
jgi:LPXTG-site transpeptidase (sortase) family protein